MYLIRNGNHFIAGSFLLLVILLGMPRSTGAQQPELPAITQQGIQRTFTRSDTSLIMSQIKAATALQYIRPDSSLVLFQQALFLSRQTGFHDGAGMALTGMGFTETARGHHAIAAYYLKTALPYCRHARFYKGLPSSWYVNMGIVNVYQGNYAVAAGYFNQALQEAQRLGLPANSAHFLSIYNNISAVYVRLDQPHSALKYLVKAEKISRQGKQFRELAFTLCNKGNACMALRQFEDAEKSFTEGLGLAKQYGYEEIAQAISNDMGELLLRQNKPARAIPYLRAAHKPGSPSSPFYNAILPGYNLGKAYYQLKDYPEAERYLTRTLQRARETGFTDGMPDAYQTLAHVYEQQHKYTQALQMQRTYIQLKDSLLNKEKAKDINELEIKYNSVQKDKELAEKQLLISRQFIRLQQKNTWIWASVAGLALLSALSFLIIRNNRNKQHILAGRLNLMEQEQQIKLLRASVDGEEQERIRIGRELHDGIGGLLSAAKLQMGSLKLKYTDIGEKEDFAKAVLMLDEANAEIRKTAHNLMPEVLLKGGIAAAVSSFCERVTTGDTLQIRTQIYGDIPRLEPHFELSVYRIIQELIQNIFKHANASEALVQLNWQEHSLHISVEDNGRGMDAASPHNGIGLKNIASRVDALGGSMEIESSSGIGTSIYIDFDRNRKALKP